MMYERFRSFPGTIMLSLLLLSTLACDGYPVIAQAQNPSEDAKNKSLTVTVKTFEQLAFHPLKKAPAYVVTLQNSLLSAQITAIVDQIHVKVGDQVKQGQLLVAVSYTHLRAHETT